MDRSQICRPLPKPSNASPAMSWSDQTRIGAGSGEHQDQRMVGPVRRRRSSNGLRRGFAFAGMTCRAGACPGLGRARQAAPLRARIAQLTPLPQNRPVDANGRFLTFAISRRDSLLARPRCRLTLRQRAILQADWDEPSAPTKSLREPAEQGSAPPREE